MKHTLSSTVGVARLIERLACTVRFRGKMGEGRVSTEAIALILARPGGPFFRDTGLESARCRDSAISPLMNLHTLKNHKSMSTRIQSFTAVQHLTKALFLSEPARPPLSVVTALAWCGSDWARYPTEWIGINKMLAMLPLSLFLFVTGMIIYGIGLTTVQGAADKNEGRPA